MGKKFRKFSTNCVCLSLTAAVIISPYLKKEPINYTAADKTNNPCYLEEIKKLSTQEDITFHNQELYNLITQTIGTQPIVKDLHNIKELTIDSLSDTNLIDLKYLPNLEKLHIKNMSLDLSYLNYNSKLKDLIIWNSQVTNTSELPNSITKLELYLTDILDNILYIPYNVTALRINNTFFSNLYLKNPSNLTVLSYESFSILDLSNLEQCDNLINIHLTYSPNIKNPQVLRNLPKLTVLVLDEYAPIWLDTDTLNSLDSISKQDKEKLLNISKELDNITSSIISSDMTDEEKVKQITLYTSDLIEYDLYTLSNNKDSQSILNTYNLFPLTFALKGDGVCINYASLFQALLNRANVNSYQDISPGHTWNQVSLNNQEYTSYDIANIDRQQAIIKGPNNEPKTDYDNSYLTYFENNQEQQLYLYNFDPDNIQDEQNLYEETIKQPILLPEEINIGYVNNSYPKSEIEKLEIRYNTLKKLSPIIPITIIYNIIGKIIEKHKEKRKVLHK